MYRKLQDYIQHHCSAIYGSSRLNFIEKVILVLCVKTGSGAVGAEPAPEPSELSRLRSRWSRAGSGAVLSGAGSEIVWSRSEPFCSSLLHINSLLRTVLL